MQQTKSIINSDYDTSISYSRFAFFVGSKSYSILLIINGPIQDMLGLQTNSKYTQPFKISLSLYLLYNQLQFYTWYLGIIIDAMMHAASIVYGQKNKHIEVGELVVTMITSTLVQIPYYHTFIYKNYSTREVTILLHECIKDSIK